MLLEEERIVLPERLNNKFVFSFSSSLARKKPARRYVFDFSALNRAFPFSILLAAAVIRQFISRAVTMCEALGTVPVFTHTGIDLVGNDAHGYLWHIGFFQHAGINAGRLPGDAQGGVSSVPITVISKKAVEEEAAHKARHYGEILISHSERLAAVIASASGLELHKVRQSQLFKISAYCIREIIRNALEHSDSPEVMVCGQYYKSLNTVEIGILDEGIGVDRALSRIHDLADVRMALELAVKPGVSGVSAEEAASSGKWGNSGFGLYTTSKLCTVHSKGAFVLASNGNSLSIQRDGQYFNKVFFSGTAVMLKLYFSDSLPYDDLLDKFIDEGERYAGIIRKSPSASQMSRVI